MSEASGLRSSLHEILSAPDRDGSHIDVEYQSSKPYRGIATPRKEARNNMMPLLGLAVIAGIVIMLMTRKHGDNNEQIDNNKPSFNEEIDEDGRDPLFQPFE